MIIKTIAESADIALSEIDKYDENTTFGQFFTEMADQARQPGYKEAAKALEGFKADGTKEFDALNGMIYEGTFAAIELVKRYEQMSGSIITDLTNPVAIVDKVNEIRMGEVASYAMDDADVSAQDDMTEDTAREVKDSLIDLKGEYSN